MVFLLGKISLICHALLWGERGGAQGPPCFANVDGSMLKIVQLGENSTKQHAMLYRFYKARRTHLCKQCAGKHVLQMMTDLN